MARGKGIYKRGDVYWIRYVGTDGKQRREPAGRNFAVAEAKLIDARKKVRDGQDPEPTVKVPNLTISELAVDYLEWAERQKAFKGKKGAVNLLLKEFGGMPLRRFNTLTVETYQTNLLKAGKAAATVNRYMATLKHMIRKATDWEKCGEDVLKRVRRAKQLPENNRRLRYLSQEEIQALLAACVPMIQVVGVDSKGRKKVARVNPLLRPIVITALNTGMRRSEILGLQWDKNIDLKHGYVLLDVTKNGERRQIPITPTLRETLESLPRIEGCPYVFTARNKERIKDPSTGFEAAVKRAGIVDFVFHDLRHTFASHLVMGGVPLTTVRDLMGHKNISMTLRYSHLAPEHKTAAIAVLENVWKGSAKSTKKAQSEVQTGVISNSVVATA